MPKQSNYRSVFSNPIFEVGEFEVEYGDGTVKTYSKIVKQDSVVIVPVTDKGEIVFIREYHAAVDRTFLTLPGGMVDSGERPEETARRELIEETGYRAGKMERLAELLMTPGYLQQTSFGFLATELRQVKQQLENGEQIQVELHSIESIEALIEKKELIEARDMALCFIAITKVRPR